jgi:signal peptidase
VALFGKPVVWLAALGMAVVVGFLLLVAPNYKLYLIHTGSMTPTIPIGSAVLVHRGPVRVGQIITFRPFDGSTVVTHRLVGVNANGTLITKGDANKTTDVDIVTRANVIGHVVAAPRHLGTWINFAFHTTRGLIFDALLLVILTVLLSNPAAVKKAAGHHRALRD